MKRWGKKLAALVLCAVMVCGILPGLMPAAKAELQGSGTSEDPYLIGSAADLKYWEFLNIYDGSSYAKLTADIDLGNEEWEPIDDFYGVFDGNYHTIFNLKIDKDEGWTTGLFKLLAQEGIVKNLALNGSVKGDQYIGSIVATNYGTVSNCHSTVTVEGIDGSRFVGSLIGFNVATVRDCSYCSMVSTSEEDTTSAIGNHDGDVTNCRRITLRKSGQSDFNATVSFNGTTPQITFSLKDPEHSSFYNMIMVDQEGRQTVLPLEKPVPVPDEDMEIQVMANRGVIDRELKDVVVNEGYARGDVVLSLTYENSDNSCAIFYNEAGDPVDHGSTWSWFETNADGTETGETVCTTANFVLPAGKDPGVYYYFCFVTPGSGLDSRYQIRTRVVKVEVVAEEKPDIVYSANGAPAEYKIGSGENLVYTVKRSVNDEETFGNFTGATMDGKAIPAGGMTTAKGSLVLTLKSGYLDTLGAGDHKLKISFTDGEMESSLKIRAAAPTAAPAAVKIPKTGDSGNPAVWIILVLAGLCGLGAVLKVRQSGKKK